VSNPDLVDIEKRWEDMHPKNQAEIWMMLRDRMKNDWHDLTFHEKKASYWIAFGEHSARKMPDTGDPKDIARLTMYGIIAAMVVFAATRAMARPAPHTMTKEWQEATEEYMKKQKMEPITGYKGMMVQSKPEAQLKGKILKPE
jgi:cytochrome c oxidase subunit 4